MTIKADEITQIIRDQIGDYTLDVDVAEVGTVVLGWRRHCPSPRDRERHGYRDA